MRSHAHRCAIAPWMAAVAITRPCLCHTHARALLRAQLCGRAWARTSTRLRIARGVPAGAVQ
eukprot:13690978-Alexandrium_andersonii.AAC.1